MLELSKTANTLMRLQISPERSYNETLTWPCDGKLCSGS